MKNLKTAIVILLAAVMLSACATNGAVTPETTEEPTPAVTAEPTAEPTPDINSYDYSSKTLTISDLEGKYKTQGRNALVTYQLKKTVPETTGLALYYSAATFEFNAYCEGDVSVNIGTKPTDIGGSNLYLNVYVDGVKQGTVRKDFRISGSKLKDVVIATGLERGYHTFVIERQTEAERGMIYINSVTLSGEIAEKTADNALFIEFIGDSITAGYGDLYPDLTDGEKDTYAASNVYEDGTITYAALTAKALNADYSIVCQQGIGVTSGYYEHTMLKTYTDTCYQGDNTDTWSFSRKADAVVINMGTNDHTMVGYGKITTDQMEKGFEKFLALVREYNPDAKIVWAYGMMDQAASEQIQEAIANAGGESAGFYFVQLTQNYGGGNGHPTAAAHAENAEILTAALKTILSIN